MNPLKRIYWSLTETKKDDSKVKAAVIIFTEQSMFFPRNSFLSDKIFQNSLTIRKYSHRGGVPVFIFRFVSTKKIFLFEIIIS